MHPALRLLAADDGAVVVDDVGVDGVVVAEGDDGRDELGRSASGSGNCLEYENADPGQNNPLGYLGQIRTSFFGQLGRRFRR